MPGIIDGSRRRRIAAGAGVQVQDVNRLLKQFLDMQKLMKGMKGGKARASAGRSEGALPGLPRPVKSGLALGQLVPAL